jgi:hypothetical protein
MLSTALVVGPVSTDNPPQRRLSSSPPPHQSSGTFCFQRSSWHRSIKACSSDVYRVRKSGNSSSKCFNPWLSTISTSVSYAPGKKHLLSPEGRPAPAAPSSSAFMSRHFCGSGSDRTHPLTRWLPLLEPRMRPQGWNPRKLASANKIPNPPCFYCAPNAITLSIVRPRFQCSPFWPRVEEAQSKTMNTPARARSLPWLSIIPTFASSPAHGPLLGHDC